MPMGARTKRGGNRASHAVDWGRPSIKKPTKALNPHAHLDGRECPTCHSVVGVRQDGQLRNHRVGTNRRNSWPCPGEEIYA
jgi:hypothetical protein